MGNIGKGEKDVRGDKAATVLVLVYTLCSSAKWHCCLELRCRIVDDIENSHNANHSACFDHPDRADTSDCLDSLDRW